MSKSERTKILSAIAREKFVGRTEEQDDLLRHAKEGGDSKGLAVLSIPGGGLTELLTQTYDQLFYEQGNIIPIYFQVKKSDKTCEQLALRFLQTFLQQTVAFRRNDPKIISAFPDVCEIAELSIPSDGYWVDRLIETCETRSRLNDKGMFFRQAFSAPLRAASHGADAFVMIDDLQNAERLSGDISVIDELKEIFARSKNTFVFAGKRRFLFKKAQNGNTVKDSLKTLEINELSFSDGGLLAESLASQFELNITDQTRDLIAQQFGGNPSFIRSLFQTANEKGVDLDTFQKVEETYAEAILGGKIKGYFDSIFESIAPDVEIRKALLSLLYNALTIEKGLNPIESWRKHLALNTQEFYRAMCRLNASEIIRRSSNYVEVMDNNDTLRDYITSRFRLEVRGDSRSLVVAESISEFLKRAPKKMARFYRRLTAIGLRELMAVFDCQEVPVGMIDYETFKTQHKGNSPDEIDTAIKNETETVKLPQIVYTANTVSLYSPISKLTEAERSAVALGFEAADYKDESEIVWIAAEIDSKLEADDKLTAFWCDRLEMVALMCDFSNFRLWLIAPEGFSPESIEILKRRNAIGSSRAQIDLLAKFLDAEEIVADRSPSNEYEMVLPMGDDTELIAAYAVEEIARRHHFGSKAINQIKTALVEACINAAEHSHSPDRKIYQKFKIEDDKIIITISNRGLRFKGKETKEINPDEGRRGWGLKLMKSLMDEVKFEQVDDGTRISMTKNLVATAD